MHAAPANWAWRAWPASPQRRLFSATENHCVRVCSGPDSSCDFMQLACWLKCLLIATLAGNAIHVYVGLSWNQCLHSRQAAFLRPMPAEPAGFSIPHRRSWSSHHADLFTQIASSLQPVSWCRISLHWRHRRSSSCSSCCSRNSSRTGIGVIGGSCSCFSVALQQGQNCRHGRLL